MDMMTTENPNETTTLPVIVHNLREVWKALFMKNLAPDDYDQAARAVAAALDYLDELL